MADTHYRIEARADTESVLVDLANTHCYNVDGPNYYPEAGIYAITGWTPVTPEDIQRAYRSVAVQTLDTKQVSGNGGDDATGGVSAREMVLGAIVLGMGYTYLSGRQSTTPP